MIRNRALPFLGECYADEARPFSSQDVCNWLPAAAEKPGTLTPEMAQTPPGLAPFVEIAGTGGGEMPFIPSKPVRGTYNCEGKLFAVIGNKLYQITNNGVAIPIGTIPGVTRIRFAHNQITNGNQLVTVNGSAGYVYDTPTQVFERITDPGYPGAITADFVDGYIVGIEPGRRFAFNSDLANAREYNTLDRFTSEYKPDLLVTQVVSNNELILLSESSGEVFYNSGASQQPFRTKRVFFDKGCSGRCNAAVIDNSFVFHANDGMFYLYQNGVPKRISTRPIEQAVAGLNWAQGFAEVWIDGGHSVVYWTFPGGHTWGWDASSGKWHRRASYGMDRWRANTLTKWTRSAPGKRDEWIAGDFQTGRLWRVDWDYLLEGDQEFVSEIVGVVLSDNQNPLVMPRMEVMLDTGQELTVPRDFPVQPPIPSITGAAPDGVRFLPYGSFSYATSGGTGALSVTRRPGSVDIPGLTFSSGAWTGTPTTEFTESSYVDYAQTIRVTDENGLWSEIADTIRITASIMALVTENNIYTAVPGGLTEGIVTGLGAASSSSMSVTANTRFLVAGFASGQHLRMYEIKEDRSGYDLLAAPADDPAGAPISTDFSPDGLYLAVVFKIPAGNYTLYVYRVDDGVPVKVAEEDSGTPNGAAWIRWAPSGERLAWVTYESGSDHGGRLYDWDQPTETLSNLTVMNAASFPSGSHGWEWSPNNKWLATMDSQQLQVINTTVSPCTVMATAAAGEIDSYNGVAWSPDGSLIFAASSAGFSGKYVGVYGWNESSLSAATYPASQPSGADCLALNSDGSLLAIGYNNSGDSIFLYDVAGSALTLAATQPTTTDGDTTQCRFTGSGLSE